MDFELNLKYLRFFEVNQQPNKTPLTIKERLRSGPNRYRHILQRSKSLSKITDSKLSKKDSRARKNLKIGIFPVECIHKKRPA